MNDQLSPLAYELARIPAAGGLVQRRAAITSFLTETVATCVSLTDEERSRATFYEVIEEAGSRVVVPAESSGRGDPATSRLHTAKRCARSSCPGGIAGASPPPPERPTHSRR